MKCLMKGVCNGAGDDDTLLRRGNRQVREQQDDNDPKRRARQTGELFSLTKTSRSRNLSHGPYASDLEATFAQRPWMTPLHWISGPDRKREAALILEICCVELSSGQ